MNPMMYKLTQNHKPSECAQRPPLDLIEKGMHEMLDSALTMGYATGSIGSTLKEEDEHFTYEVSYTIRRKSSSWKRRKGFRVPANPAVAESGGKA